MKRSRRIVLSAMVMLHQVYFSCWCKVPNIYKVGNVNGCYRDGYNPYALVRPQTDWHNTKNDFYCELTPSDACFGCTPVAMVFGSKFSLAHSINMSKVNKHSRISVEYHLFQWINIHCRAQSHTAHPYILHLIPICSARLHFARWLGFFHSLYLFLGVVSMDWLAELWINHSVTQYLHRCTGA